MADQTKHEEVASSQDAEWLRSPSASTGGPSILIVDDEPALLRVYERILTHEGFRVTSTTNGESATELLDQGHFDVVMSDIDMPRIDGITLLGNIRRRDLDVPVIFVTGLPSIETAVKAIEQGALRYLVKPVDSEALVKVITDAVRLHRIARAKREALNLAGGADRLVGDRAGLEVSFQYAVRSLYVAYQPIVSWAGRSVFAYEALLRSREPRLPHPGAVLDAAERLGRLTALGREVRAKAIAPLPGLPSDVALFVNLHPEELLDASLLSDEIPSALASRIVLEITERASLHRIGDVQSRIGLLRQRGFRIAIDDLGAGYAGLNSFALLQPDIVKLDMTLIRDLDRDLTKRTLVRTMITMCRELGIGVISEGIETVQERDELIQAGCDLMQGYLFAKPANPIPTPLF